MERGGSLAESMMLDWTTIGHVAASDLVFGEPYLRW